MTDPFTRRVPTLKEQQELMVRDLEESWRLGETDPATKPVFPVIYCPSHEVIGAAATERGALNCVARHVRKQKNKRWTASLAERLGENDEPAGKAWFTGPQLIQGGSA